MSVGSPQVGSLTIASLRAIQSDAWRHGQRVLVETLLQQHPQHRLSDDEFLELILSEHQLRCELEGKPTDEEYYARFPALKERLARLLEMQRAFDETHTGQERSSVSASEPMVIGQAISHSGPVASPTPATVSAGTGSSLGPYRLGAKLGEGGMGAVYKAVHSKLDKTVALKILPAEMMNRPDAVSRFEREMKAVGKLSDPHIVQAFDAGEYDGTHYLAMEFVDGKDLSQLIKAKGPLPVMQACEAVRQAALGLAVAHQHQLVHRDIKPSNLLVTKTGQIKILDLGLARLAEHSSLGELTKSNQCMGTPDYMSPEQWEDAHTVDHRCDLYSLGCTLFFLLTGKAPYADDNHQTLPRKMTGHVLEPIPDLPAARRAGCRDWACKTNAVASGKTILKTVPTDAEPTDIPPELDAIYQKLLAKKPEGRFGSADELVEALAPLVKRLKSNVTELPVAELARVRTQPAIPDPVVAELPVAELVRVRTPPTNLSATLLVRVVPALLHYLKSSMKRVAHKRGNHRDEPGGGQIQPARPIEATSNSEVTSITDATIKLPEETGKSAHPTRRIPRRIAIGLAALSLFVVAIALGVITVMTPDGKLLIESEVDDVDVVVSQQGRVVKVIDQQTGSQVTLTSGDYSLSLKDDRNDVQLSKNRITLKRGKAEIVKITRVKLGWHDWPADAPPPAIAPFDAAQAKQHQQAWAEYLKLPVEYTNSLGMKFVLIPPGEFTMGSTAAEIEEALKVAGEDQHWRESIKSEAPQHKVILTQAIYLGVHEVTQKEYEAVMQATPSHFASTGPGKEAVENLDTQNHPVEKVSWNDAAEFCAKLSQKEELKPFYFRAGETITPLEGTGYRLPTEAEWEFACRAGTTTRYWIGDKDDELVRAGWFGTNSGGRTHAAGELKVNPLGLYDIHGNVWEWVEDAWEPTYYGQFADKPAINPNDPSCAGSQRVIRGGICRSTASHCRSSDRYSYDPTLRDWHIGFRVSLVADAVKESLKRQGGAVVAKKGWHGWPADAPPPAIAPFDAAQAKQHQQAWADYLKLPVEYTNSLGMKFVLIPPGEFTMGSTQAEIEEALKHVDPNDQQWQECIKREAPQHKVILTQPIYLGVNEVTQKEYEAVMKATPSHFASTEQGKNAVPNLDTQNHPVESVSWNDAGEFCARLSQKDNLKPFFFRAGETVTPLKGTGYRLPTEAEWEFACRAGTTTKFCIGDKDEELVRVGWFAGNSGERTHAAGELKANPLGLFDVHGNVWEWVEDSWEQFVQKPSVNPNGPSPAGFQRVIRGGDWRSPASGCRSSNRNRVDPSDRYYSVGFRVSLTVDAVKAASTTSRQKLIGLNDSRRKALEKLLAMGGSLDVIVGEEQRNVPAKGELPTEVFRLNAVSLRGIESLKVADCKLLNDLGEIPYLEFMGSALSDDCFQAITELREVRGLRFQHFGIDDGRIGGLAEKMPQLTKLSISDVPFSDTALDHVARLKNLEILHFQGAAITGTHWNRLEPLSKLRELSFHKSSIKTLVGLPAFPKLDYLGLEFSLVTDEELIHLEQVKSLKRITLQETKVTQAGIDKLHQALPQCRIEWDKGVVEPVATERDTAKPQPK